jgi:molecular chaperone GrpE (heat shock protein)
MWGPRAAAAVTCGGKKRKLEELEDKNQELKDKNQELKEETQKLTRRYTAQVQANNKKAGFGRVSSMG